MQNDSTCPLLAMSALPAGVHVELNVYTGQKDQMKPIEFYGKNVIPRLRS
jgi:hypothetical protein